MTPTLYIEVGSSPRLKTATFEPPDAGVRGPTNVFLDNSDRLSQTGTEKQE